MDAAQKAYDEYMASVFTRYNFLEDLHTDKERRCVELRKSMAFGIKDRLNRSSVLNWCRRKDDEARSIVNDIIVELELGGALWATTRRVYARVLLHKFFVAFLCKLPA